MSFVEYKGKIVPAGTFFPSEKSKYECGICMDVHLTRESWDEERYDVMVPCWKCRPFCKACRKYRPKGHDCEPKGETK